MIFPAVTVPRGVPVRCAGTQKTIKIWDLESKSLVDELVPDLAQVGRKAQAAYCTSLCWSGDGQTLFAGYTDGVIRVWGVGH